MRENTVAKMEDRKCYNCKHYGHYARDCMIPRNAPRKIMQPRSTSPVIKSRRIQEQSPRATSEKSMSRSPEPQDRRESSPPRKVRIKGKQETRKIHLIDNRRSKERKMSEKEAKRKEGEEDSDYEVNINLEKNEREEIEEITEEDDTKDMNQSATELLEEKWTRKLTKKENEWKQVEEKLKKEILKEKQRF